METVNLTDSQKKARRGRNIALGAVLLFLYDELLRRFARLYRRRKRG